MNLRPLLISAFLVGLLPVVAAAGSFTVSPVRVELSPARPLSSITLSNDADTPIQIEVRGVAWSQNEAEDVYADTRELIVTPPVFTLPGKGSQIIRLGLRRNPDAKDELAYRIFLSEVKPAVQSEATGVTMNLRLSVPVFVKPVAAAQPRLDWTARRAEGGALLLRADNRSNTHVQVANLKLAKGNEVAGQLSSAAYLLPGQGREWTIQPEPGHAFTAPSITLSGFSDAGEVKVDLAIP
jgi:fimbrial chaperone protein